MKKEKIQAFFQGKSFYLSLLIGTCAVFAVAIISINLKSNEKGNNLVDLNEPMDVAEQSENQSTDGTGISNQVDTSLDTAGNLPSTEELAQMENDRLLENDIISEEEQLANDTRETLNNTADNTEDEIETAEEEPTVPVINTAKSNNLSFNEEIGLLWPMNGNIIKNYSMDKVVYFETLNQFKCNPAILIGGDVDTEVVSAATGIVTKIYENDETGHTLVMEIGDGYTLEYGQLKNIKAKVGDKIEEGTMIANIAEPTNYYVVEGSNLYFKVTQNDESVNPMLLLR